jgi:glutamate N-acetyltransferase/amino-acid N-acetyltransferase
MKWMPGGVTAARGFLAAGVSAGIKRGRKLDLALVVSEAPAMAAATFTTNTVKAAPILISQQRIRAGKAMAVLLNSGCANCLTGQAGMHDALTLSRLTARELGIAEEQLQLASTGLIGSRLPVGKIERALPSLIRGLSRAHHRQAARAILTTDTVPKEAAVAESIAGATVHLGGMAKGVGMMAPRMATMLCVLSTDAAVDHRLLAEWLREAVDASFNRITVDGDMSTNDSVFLLSNGRVKAIKRSSFSARQTLKRASRASS